MKNQFSFKYNPKKKENFEIVLIMIEQNNGKSTYHILIQELLEVIFRF